MRSPRYRFEATDNDRRDVRTAAGFWLARYQGTRHSALMDDMAEMLAPLSEALERAR